LTRQGIACDELLDEPFDELKTSCETSIGQRSVTSIGKFLGVDRQNILYGEDKTWK
jgi:hypothetical protein